MRRLLTRLVFITLAAAGLTILAPSPASAGTDCHVIDPQTGKCVIWIEDPGPSPTPNPPKDEGPEQTGAGHRCYWDGRPQNIYEPPPGPVPCSAEYGYWSNALNCYIEQLDPQPPAGDPSWKGHRPGDGAVYQCYQPQTDLLIHVWSQDPPPNSGSGPTPREVAQVAVDDMKLRAIDIGIVPKAAVGRIGIVGMPVWMWVASPDRHTWGPITVSAAAGGITVTATARVHEITWDMGDGNEVVCTGPGTPYKAAYGNQESPDCGYVYTTSSSSEPDDRFTVTATSEWVIEWVGAGQSGTIRMNGLVREAQIAVGEAQVLVQ